MCVVPGRKDIKGNANTSSEWTSLGGSKSVRRCTEQAMTGWCLRSKYTLL